MEKVVSIDNSICAALTEQSPVIQQALKCLNSGEVIAVPTDTIYGVAAFAQSTQAVDKIYEIKKRHKEKAIAICVGTIDQVKRWGEVTVSDVILKELLPGPVTLIFKRSPLLNPSLNPTSDTIGIRIPEFPFIQKLAQACGQPLALTSANVSSSASTIKVKEFENLWPQLGLVVDGGTLGNSESCRSGSTVVDLSVPGEFLIIREGCAAKFVINVLEQKHKLKNRDS